jgi:hypothetical protein
MALTKYDIAAALEIAGLNDGKYHRLTAAEQRDLLGFPVFGKREFQVDLLNQGRVRTRWTVLPNDSAFAYYSLATVADAANNDRKLDTYPGEMP